MKTYVTVLLVMLLAAAGNAQEPKSGLGFGAGFTGGSGLSYKRYLTDNDAVQLNGLAYGNSETSFGCNLGIMYQRVLHKAKYTRLLLAPGVAWYQRIDADETNDVSAFRDHDGTVTDSLYQLGESDDSRELHGGITIGIEITAFQLGLSFFGGFQAALMSSYDTATDNGGTYTSRDEAKAALKYESRLELGWTADIALHYYF